jgi:molybdenum cofactor cytidylyltransferase
MISAVVLAAGKDQGVGKSKLFLPWHGQAVLQWVLESVLASAVSEVICVVRDLAVVRAHIRLNDERLSWLVNDRADARQSSSVSAGLWAVDERSDRALLVAGDQPMRDSALIDTLIERSKSTSAPLVALRSTREIRNPVLLRRELFPQLLELKGDPDGRSLVKKFRDRVEWVGWHEEARSMDIADPKDGARLKQLA